MSKIQEFKKAAQDFTSRILDNPDAAGALIFGATFTAGAIAGVAGFAAGYKGCTFLGSPADIKELVTISASAITATAAMFGTSEAISNAVWRRDVEQRKAWAIEHNAAWRRQMEQRKARTIENTTPKL